MFPYIFPPKIITAIQQIRQRALKALCLTNITMLKIIRII